MLFSSSLPPLDAWTASSLLQKSIRRGEIDYAEAAAVAFHRMRGNAIWRRLALIAFEDIGPANPDLCICVTKYATDVAARRQLGSDQEIVSQLVKQMCSAGKNREADYLICAAKQAPFTEDFRALCAGASIAERTMMAGDSNLRLLHRSVAAWMASGINGGGPQVLSSDANLPSLLANFSDLGVCKKLLLAVASASQKTGEPIVVMTPLILLAIRQANEPSFVVEEELPPSILCGGIPSWVFDKHTRLGKSAIGQLLRENREVRECIADFVPEFRATDVAAMAAFYADAVSMKRRMVWSQSDNLYRLGLRTDMTKIGTPENGVMPIVKTVRQHLDNLNDIRQRLRTGARTHSSGVSGARRPPL